MKKSNVSRWLVSTSALALATGMAGSAVAADKISLGLSGYFQAFGVVGSQDDGPGEPGAGIREHGIARESEVHFTGSSTLDNGVQVGINIELEGETSGDQIDESYIWFEGFFGRIEVGSNDAAADSMFYGVPTPIAGHGVNSPNFFHAASGANAVGTSSTFVGLTSDSDKVTYFSPRWSGFQFGISYTPDNKAATSVMDETGTGFNLDSDAGQSEAVEGAVNWVGSFSGVDIGAYGAYSFANEETGAAGTEDQEMWGAGLNLAYMGWTLGGSYRWTDQGTSGSNTDRWEANIGLTYAWSNWTVGAAYGHAEVEIGAPGEDTLDMAEVGAVYNLGPGIDLTGGVQWYDYESDTGAVGAQNEAWVALFGTSISF
jgi:predicted porin